MYRLTYLLATILMLSACMDKDDPRGYYERGLGKATRENFTQALQDFDKAIEMDSTFVDAYFARAFYVKEKTGDYKGAIEDYTKAIELKTTDNDARAFSQRGYAKFMIKDFRGAAVDYQSSISLNPADPFTYRNRALLFIQIKNWPMVCMDLKKALDLDFTKLYGDEADKLFKQYCNPDGTEK